MDQRSLTQNDKIHLSQLTFVLPEPTDSFSKNKGIAKGPNRGVALKQDLNSQVRVHEVL